MQPGGRGQRSTPYDHAQYQIGPAGEYTQPVKRKSFSCAAPQAGLEPTPLRLTVESGASQKK